MASSWGSFSFAFGPVIAFAALGVLVLLLRWAFGHGHSLVERTSRPGAEDEYGLLVPAAAAGTVVEAELLRQKLLASGITATLATTHEGPRVMVFPADLKTATAILRS